METNHSSSTRSTANSPCNHIVSLTVQVASISSILGCLLIFATFILITDYRTEARKMVIYVSIADFLTAAGNLYGILANFQGTNPWDCVLQSFITTYSSICSFFWTVFIAFFIFIKVAHFTVVKVKTATLVFHVISWTVPLIITTAALFCGVLGNGEAAGTAGWCWIRATHSASVWWMLISGKLWELAADVIIPTLYWLSRRCLGQQQSKVSNKALRRTSNLVNKVNMKLLLIPLAFLIMRMWGTIRSLLYIAGQVEAEQNCVLRTLHGFGDSFQGGTNCLLFCLMSDTVRRHLCFGWKKMQRTRSNSEFEMPPKVRKFQAWPKLLRRGVRTMKPTDLKAPYPLKFRSKGLTERGPLYYEQWEWPDKESGWTGLSPKFKKCNSPSLWDYTGCQPTGYVNPTSGEFVVVPEMIPELVVPSLKGFKLKPYVSYRVSENEADTPEFTAKDLFLIHFAKKVKADFAAGKYDNEPEVGAESK